MIELSIKKDPVSAAAVRICNRIWELWTKANRGDLDEIIIDIHGICQEEIETAIKETKNDS